MLFFSFIYLRRDDFEGGTSSDRSKTSQKDKSFESRQNKEAFRLFLGVSYDCTYNAGTVYFYLWPIVQNFTLASPNGVHLDSMSGQD